MRFPLFLLVLFVCGVPQALFAQETYNLERCIMQARAKNPELQIAQLNTRLAMLETQTAQNARMPQVIANTNLGGQFGYTVDPTTSNFVNRAVGFNSLGLDIGMPIYSGGLLQASIKQSVFSQRAAESDAAAAANNLGLAVAQAYLQVLLFEEQLVVAQKRMELTVQNQNRTEKLIAAGSLPANARLDVLAQLARDEQNQVANQNALESALVQLKNLMQVEPDLPIKLEKPSQSVATEVNPDAYGLKPIFNAALGNQPQIIAADYRLQAARTGIDMAQASKKPTINIFGGLNSNYSTLGQRLDSISTFYNNSTVIIGGNPVEVGFPNARPNLSNNPYANQLRQNFGQSVGLNVRIPIYDQRRARNNVERARLVVQQQEALKNQTQQQLKTDIQNAIVNARAARQTLNAGQKSYEALKAAYENTERRFQAGSTSSFEMVNARNALDVAETNLVIAKYDYLFRIKIVEFYQGKALKL